MGSLVCGAGLVLLPRFSASGFLDSARRHGATEFNAIGAMLEILMRQPERPDDADTDLRLCYTGPSPEREWQEAFEERFGLRSRVRLRDVGVAVRPDLAARHPAVRHARHARASTRGSARSTRPGRRRRRRRRRGRRHRRAAAAQPGGDAGLLGDAGSDGGDHRRRLAAHRRPGDAERRRHRARSSRGRRRCCDGAARTCHPPRSRRRSPPIPTSWSAPSSASRPSCPRRRSRRTSSRLPGGELDFAALRGVDGRTAHAPSRCPRFWQALDALPRTPTARVAKHQLPSGHSDQEWDSES